MTTLYTGRIQGQMEGGAALATKTIEVYGNGTVRFTDASGQPRSVQPTGALAVLFQELFAGASGMPRWFV